ncbi:MAG: MTAP family purine nucleoside phosphorylase, partial [Desulfobulbaceae bacterium]|nr:MTAP family purine nucleoside phosphorylase [Desulfobulbaceae bacterium]
MIKIGIIGGSGLDDPDILRDAEEIAVETPYGAPSSVLTYGRIEGVEIFILARHGKNHFISPSAVNFRANIHALKEQGCTHILAATAVGSLREEIEPGHLVFPDQFIDHTRKRETTFFDKGPVMHTPMAEPFCPNLIALLSESAKGLGIPFHSNRTVITVEGPRFSTKAESHMFRSWNADVINMSTVPEVNLAREK